MSGTAYVRDQVIRYSWKLMLMLLLTFFLLTVGNTYDTLSIIWGAWMMITIISEMIKFRRRNRYLSDLYQTTKILKERYLISDVMAPPQRVDDQVFYEVLKMANRSMLEEIAKVKRDRKEYKEYIEQWIHEIKTPIAAMHLLCENQRIKSRDERENEINARQGTKTFIRNMLLELEKTTQIAEQALYYARSEHIERDYMIREVLAEDIIHQAIAGHKQLLMSHDVQIEVLECHQFIYTDEKWIGFILSQIIRNAVQYKAVEARIVFYINRTKEGIVLNISDNGIGILPEDLPRIFDKGFTGHNGRQRKSATGIGLYLSKKLCDKLGVGLVAKANEQGLTIQLHFYENEIVKIHS